MSGAARLATTKRSVSLFRSFRVEQSKPEVFYTALAQDAVAQVGAYVPLRGAALLDIGGGPGYFADAFRRAGAWYTALDADAGEFNLHGRTPAAGSVLGDGTALPIRTNSVDIAYSSNVAEHVRQPWQLGDEMVRIARPGGYVFLSYTVWLGPWGGHETAPWHYLGGERAANRYQRKKGHEPKNKFGESLFPLSARAGLDWAHDCAAADLVHAVPRYLPSWGWFVLRVPGLREVATWNLLLVLRKR